MEQTPDWLRKAYQKVEHMPEQAKAVRQAAENDLWFFARLVNPGYMYGNIHKDIYHFIQDYSLYGVGTASSDKLIMLPRAHLKSHCVATACAWLIVRHPEITILYTSATAELAIKQLYDIQNILDSRVFKKYWPEYIHPEIGKREKWAATSIIIDHPKRKLEGIRDATIATAGLTTNTTGWHADVVVADDLVVPENAYTPEGRESVSKKSSQFTSIRNPGGFTIACGTRYHPKDVYDTWKAAKYEVYDDSGDVIDIRQVWEIQEYTVEDDGEFLWPRVVRKDGKAFGFNLGELSRIKAGYTDKTQFFAQYYNNPNAAENAKLSYDVFQYYNPKFLIKEGSSWYYNGERLNVYAAVDFAYSLSSDADYTAVVVIGIDCEDNIYVLDIDRFKSFKTIDYFQSIKRLHATWNFKKIQAEVTAAQKTIVESIKDYVRKDGLKLKVEEFRPSKALGSKEERIAAILEHRYEDRSMWHREGGWTPLLEEELVSTTPAHDDISDALASAVSIAIKPQRSHANKMKDFMTNNNINRSRFGGYQ